MRRLLSLCTAIASILLASCSASMPRRDTPPPEIPTLVVASCPWPPIPPLTTGTFGETTEALVQVLAVYRECLTSMGMKVHPP